MDEEPAKPPSVDTHPAETTDAELAHHTLWLGDTVQHEINELIAAKDNKLAIIAAGDSTTPLDFDAHLAAIPTDRHHAALFSVHQRLGRDADFHVAQGWTVEPLPWHGMNNQIYGREPDKLDDAWIKKYNTLDRATFHKLNSFDPIKKQVTLTKFNTLAFALLLAATASVFAGQHRQHLVHRGESN